MDFFSPQHELETFCRVGDKTQKHQRSQLQSRDLKTCSCLCLYLFMVTFPDQSSFLYLAPQCLKSSIPFTFTCLKISVLGWNYLDVLCKNIIIFHRKAWDADEAFYSLLDEFFFFLEQCIKSEEPELKLLKQDMRYDKKKNHKKGRQLLSHLV